MATAVCTILVYRKVQTYDRITAKYRRPPDDSPSVDRDPQQLHHHHPEIYSVASEGSASPPSQTTKSWRSPCSGYHSKKSNRVFERATRGIHDDDDYIQHESIQGNMGSHPGGLEQIDEREVDAYAEEPAPFWDVRSKWKRWQLKRQIFREDNPRTAEVFHQALWYLGGFLNFLVYQRPRYVRVRKACPELGSWGALKVALMFTFVSGEDPLYRPVAAAQSRRWPFASRKNLRLSSVDGLTGEFYIPEHRERISSVSGVSEMVVDAVKPEHLSVVPEDSTELSSTELKRKSEQLPSSILNSKRDDTECDTNDSATPCCEDK
eukprot:scaffold34615_cov180-Amphora_coffeaeformis.AAC.8